MKLRHLLFALILAVPVFSQSYGPAKGFPSDPVISAVYHDGSLYLGTQGSGVFKLDKDWIVPADGFEEFSTASIYDFEVKDGALTPLTTGQLQEYPILVTNSKGTTYSLTDGLLQVIYLDMAREVSREAAGIWRFETLPFKEFEKGAVFIRTGSTLKAYSSDGQLVDETTFLGLIFDLAHTPEGLLLSTEGGYYQWRGHWHKIGSGLPIFAFDGDRARTPIGAIHTAKLLSGNWSIADVEEMEVVRESHANYYDVDTLANLFGGFSGAGLEIFSLEGTVFRIDRARGLPNLRPGNYDLALLDGKLWVATPQGLYTFENSGFPNPLDSVHWNFLQDGLPKTWDTLSTAPQSIAFNAEVDYEGASQLYARYRINGESWQDWSLDQGVLFDHPAPGSYKLEVEISPYLDYRDARATQVSYTIRAEWYKRPWIWVVLVLLVAGLVILWQRRERLKTAEKLLLQERLAEAELASKRNQMNPHFLFNALDAISNFIYKNQPKDAVTYLGKLAKLMRLTLDTTRSSTMVLQDELDLLQQYVDLCELRYGSFQTQFTVDDELDTFDIHLPPMLLQPLIENAVQHAVRPNMRADKAGVISLKIAPVQGGIQVVVKDNGPGFDVDAVNSTSHGLAILRERLELLSKKYGKPFDVRIDSKVSDPLHSGTTISLILSTDVLD